MVNKKLGELKMNNNFKKAIFELPKIVSHEGDNWFVFGGYNLYLHGIEHDPADIDIFCNESAFECFKKFLETRHKLEDKNDPEDNYIQFEIQDFYGVKLEVFCEIKTNYYRDYLKKEDIDIIKVDDKKVPCLGLIPQAIAYLEVYRNGRGRDLKDPEKAIKNTIKILKFLKEGRKIN